MSLDNFQVSPEQFEADCQYLWQFEKRVSMALEVKEQDGRFMSYLILTQNNSDQKCKAGGPKEATNRIGAIYDCATKEEAITTVCLRVHERAEQLRKERNLGN